MEFLLTWAPTRPGHPGDPVQHTRTDAWTTMMKVAACTLLATPDGIMPSRTPRHLSCIPIRHTFASSIPWASTMDPYIGTNLWTPPMDITPGLQPRTCEPPYICWSIVATLTINLLRPFHYVMFSYVMSSFPRFIKEVVVLNHSKLSLYVPWFGTKTRNVSFLDIESWIVMVGVIDVSTS